MIPNGCGWHPPRLLARLRLACRAGGWRRNEGMLMSFTYGGVGFG